MLKRKMTRRMYLATVVAAGLGIGSMILTERTPAVAQPQTQPGPWVCALGRG